MLCLIMLNILMIFVALLSVIIKLNLLNAFMICVVMLSVIIKLNFAECLYDLCCYAECHN
jgi:hypothetical protein